MEWKLISFLGSSLGVGSGMSKTQPNLFSFYLKLGSSVFKEMGIKDKFASKCLLQAIMVVLDEKLVYELEFKKGHRGCS